MAATRTQIYLTSQQRRRLDSLRRRNGRSLAALIREAVDAYLAGEGSDPAAALAVSFGRLPNLVVPPRDEWDRA